MEPRGPGRRRNNGYTLSVEAKRKLEATYSKDLKDGALAASGQGPVASLGPTEEQFPTTKPSAETAPVEKHRFETSLVLLTQRFAEMLRHSVDGVVDLNLVVEKLNICKRRVYDITNVLEGIKLIQKKSKNYVQWLGGEVAGNAAQEVQELREKEQRLDELIAMCMWQVQNICEDEDNHRFAYLTYDDVQRIPSLKDQTVIVIKAPAETKLEVPHPEESLQVHLSSKQGPIEVFVCSDDPSHMDTTENTETNGSYTDLTTNGHDYTLSLPHTSSVQVSRRDNDSHASGTNSTPTPGVQTTSNVVTLRPFSVQSPFEEQQSFVTLTPPVGLPLEGAGYSLSLAEDEGITDLFSSVDLDQLSLDMSS